MTMPHRSDVYEAVDQGLKIWFSLPKLLPKLSLCVWYLLPFKSVTPSSSVGSVTQNMALHSNTVGSLTTCFERMIGPLFMSLTTP